MIEALFLLQYSLLNGWLIQKWFIIQRFPSWGKTLMQSIMISLSLNSLVLYILIKRGSMDISFTNTALMSFSITGILLLMGSLKKYLKNQ